MAKKSISPTESWIVAVLNLPEKHTGSFFFPWQQQLWSWFWVFWNKKDVSDFLLWSHLTVLFHQMRVTTVTVSKFTEHSPLTFFSSWNGAACLRCVFTQLWNSQETCFCEPGNWALMVKPIVYLFGSWIIAASNQTKPWGFIFLFITTTALAKFLVFWMQQVACHFLLGSHLIVQLHLIRVKKVVVVRTLSPNIFSHGMVQCVQGVSLHRSETAGKHIGLNLGIGTWWPKNYFSQVKTGELQP